MEKTRVIYYLNQFFGQEGGEEAASIGIKVHEGAFGIAQLFESEYGESCQVLATIVCGDNYIAERLEEVTAEIVDIVEKYKPDLFVAGPAYAAGRYGVACGSLCAAVNKKLKIPTVTAMNEINPGVDMYRKNVYILKTGTNARTISKDVAKMAEFAKKLVNKVELASPEVEGHFARGYKKNVVAEKKPPKRAVDMLLDKLHGREFKSEIPLPKSKNVEKPKPIEDLSKATIVLATDGGLYPYDNPDNMPTAAADRFCAYDISGIDSLKKGEWKVYHGGYDQTYANEDPNRLVPVDAMRALEKEGFIGKLHDKFLSTTGLVAPVEFATKIGKEMVQYIKDNNIDAVVLTST